MIFLSRDGTAVFAEVESERDVERKRLRSFASEPLVVLGGRSPPELAVSSSPGP